MVLSWVDGIQETPMTQKELNLLVTQHAAECVEEILSDIRDNQGIPWFLIIERKMRRLVRKVAKNKAS